MFQGVVVIKGQFEALGGEKNVVSKFFLGDVTYIFDRSPGLKSYGVLSVFVQSLARYSLRNMFKKYLTKFCILANWNFCLRQLKLRRRKFLRERRNFFKGP